MVAGATALAQFAHVVAARHPVLERWPSRAPAPLAWGTGQRRLSSHEDRTGSVVNDAARDASEHDTGEP